MKSIPFFPALFFALLALLTVWLFWRATGRHKLALLISAVWMLVQAALALSGFYFDTEAMPPRIMLQVVPSVLAIVLLFSFARTRQWMDAANEGTLTLLHTVRIGAELTIFMLFTAGLMPVELTFEGRNWDILAGLTAPVVYYFGYIKQRIGRTGLIVWNVLCLVLLFNIVIHAALAVPSPFQQMGLAQPNVAILHFPFNWLPSLVVPLVLLSQLITLRKLIRRK
ncbi:MAG: hypothetical protein MUC87_18925 [Bacteroidia bacterium]|jgi:hypothetical protein|nr:hypothetical protein [Bacteroidia bacterium]